MSVEKLKKVILIHELMEGGRTYFVCPFCSHSSRHIKIHDVETEYTLDNNVIKIDRGICEKIPQEYTGFTDNLKLN